MRLLHLLHRIAGLEFNGETASTVGTSTLEPFSRSHHVGAAAGPIYWSPDPTAFAAGHPRNKRTCHRRCLS